VGESATNANIVGPGTVTGNGDGFLIGVQLNGSNASVTGVTVTHNMGMGIAIGGLGTGNSVRGNVVTDNEHGITVAIEVTSTSGNNTIIRQLRPQQHRCWRHPDRPPGQQRELRQQHVEGQPITTHRPWVES
jgi:hypothetical protein